MLDDNILVEFMRKRAAAYRTLKHKLIVSADIFEAILSWYIRVCYFHTTGRRLINMQRIEECYGNIPFEFNGISPFKNSFQTGEIDEEYILVEPMVHIEKYDKFLTAFSNVQFWFSRNSYEDEYGDECMMLQLMYGPRNDRNTIAKIDYGTSYTIDLLTHSRT